MLSSPRGGTRSRTTSTPLCYGMTNAWRVRLAARTRTAAGCGVDAWHPMERDRFSEDWRAHRCRQQLAVMGYDPVPVRGSDPVAAENDRAGAIGVARRVDGRTSRNATLAEQVI